MADMPNPDVRTRILEAALTLLADHGVAELTQPKVARLAGVRQSHLTYYFPTRPDLLKAVAMHSMSAMSGLLAGGAADGTLTRETLGDAVGGFVADKRRARVMLGLVVASDEDPAIKVFLRAFVARVRATMADVAESIGAPVDADSVAAFHALVVGVAVLNVAQDDALSRQDCQRIAGLAVDRLLVEGLGPRPARPRGRRTTRERK